MDTIIKGVTLHSPMSTQSAVCRRNMETIVEFFSLYLKDKQRFYSLWTDGEPQVLTPFVSDDIAVCKVGVHSGWPAVKAFWDPIFDDMRGRFDWFIDEFIAGEDPNVVITRSHSVIDVKAGASWGNRHVAYNGRYIQVFRFEGGKVKAFEEYYDTALLNSKYG
jgi:hypothetical protein